MKKIFISILILNVISINSTLFAEWEVVKYWSCGTNKVICLYLKENYVFAATSSNFYMSSDNGTTWLNRSSGLTAVSITSIGSIDSTIFLTTMYGIYKSSNLGIKWVYSDSMLFLSDMLSFGSDLYVSTSCCGEGIYKSSDKGLTWFFINEGLLNRWISALGKNDTYIFAGCKIGANSGIYKSSNFGKNWLQPTSMYMDGVNTIVSVNSTVFVGTYGGIYRSTNNGTNWNYNLNSIEIECIILNEKNVFAASSQDSIAVLYSSNNGSSWIKRNEGIVNNEIGIYSLLIKDDYIFAGGESYLYRRSLDEITKVETNYTNVPNTFQLYQNYPNPFNPSTTIKIFIPFKNYVSLTVYDINGKEVNHLINEELNAGSYSIKFSCINLSSGIYFYCLKAGNYQEIRKMIVLK